MKNLNNMNRDEFLDYVEAHNLRTVTIITNAKGIGRSGVLDIEAKGVKDGETRVFKNRVLYIDSKGVQSILKPEEAHIDGWIDETTEAADVYGRVTLNEDDEFGLLTYNIDNNTATWRIASIGSIPTWFESDTNVIYFA